jgi:hypothetical protein
MIFVSKTNLKMGEVPVTAISHYPQKFPLLLLNHCFAIRGKFRAFVMGFSSGGVRGGLRCCVLDRMDYGIRGFGGVKRRADRGIRGLR